MARRCPQHRPRDRVQLRRPAGGDVALHRAAERVVRAIQLGDRDRRVDVARALGTPYRAALLDRPLQLPAQLRGGTDLAEQLVVRAGRARQRVQPHELGPHHLGLRVEHARRHPRVRQRLGERAHRLARRGVPRGHVHE